MKSFNLTIITTLTGLLITSNPHIATSQQILNSEYSQELENPSPTNVETFHETSLHIPPSLVGKGVRGLGQTIANNTTPAEIKQIAQAVTVKISSNNKRGSGVLIHKQGTTYTVITNAHVISNKSAHRIQTPDNKIHTATVINQGNSLTGNDLAVLQFQAKENYQTLPLTNTELAENQPVFAAGFPDGSKELLISSGKISLLSTQPLAGGYQIGYTNEIKQGMSGGALINQSGQLVGINGLASNAILNEAYNYQDGTKPSPEEIQKLRQLSFAVPIQTLAKVAPNLAILPPAWRNQQQAQIPAGNTFVDKVDKIAQQITVRIDSQKNGNGSGVIIAKQGNTYYVATARHVVQNPDNYEIVAPDGKRYVVQSQDIFKPEGIDAALVKFTSNQTYSVATIAKYNLSFGDAISQYNGSDFENIETSWLFLSGFPALDKGKRKLSPGFLSYGERLVFNAESNHLFQAFVERGYRLAYSNLSLPGMSGGPVLDVKGQVVGINAGIENRKISQTEIGLGYGVPSSSILRLATQAGINNNQLAVVNTKPPSLTSSETTLLATHPLISIKKPSDNASDAEIFQYANQMWRIRRFSEVIYFLEETVKRKPNFYQAYFALGAAIRSAGKDPEKALAALDKATNLKPDYYQAWLEKSFLLSAYNKYPLALAAIDKVIEYNGNDWNLYLSRASILLNLQRYQESLKNLDKSIEIQPFYLSYVMRGLIRSYFQDYQGLVTDANQAIKLEPDFALAYAIRGFGRILLKDQGGVTDLNKAIQLEPNNALAYKFRGDSYQQLKNYQDALADYNQAIKLQPRNEEVYLSRAKVRIDLKDVYGGIADFKLGVRLAIENNQGRLPDNIKQFIKQPKDAATYFIRGIIRSELKDYQGALADYHEAIKLQFNDAIVYLDRGNVYLQLKDYQAALADFNQAVKLQPESAEAYFMLGVVYQQIGDILAARLEYNQALTKDEKFVPAMINIGYILYERGDVDGAIQQWQKAVTINSKLAEPQLAIAVALYARGEQQKGLNMAQAALNLDRSWSDVETLKQNLWGKTLIAEAQKLLSHPSVQTLRVKQL